MPLQHSSIKLLEIGIQTGNSFRAWKSYFSNGLIYGIDIDHTTAFEEDRIKTFIGSQSDPQFLNMVVSKIDGLDIIIDDGSHEMSDQIFSFEYLFQHLNSHGLYIIEDLHTSYWLQFNGGYNQPNTCINFLKTLIDNINHWAHKVSPRAETLKNNAPITPLDNMIESIHFYKRMCIIKKNESTFS